MKKYNVIKVWYIKSGRRQVEYLAKSVNFTEAVNILVDEETLQRGDFTQEVTESFGNPSGYPEFYRSKNGILFWYRIEESLFDAMAELTRQKIKYEFSLN